MDVLHSLLKDGVPPGLADDQIGPLDDHNAGEEGCVAGELNDLSALVSLRYRRVQEKKDQYLFLFCSIPWKQE